MKQWKLKSRIGLYAFLLLAMATLAALLIIVDFSALFAGKEAAQVEFLIGMSQANLIEPWRIAMNRETMAAARKYDNLRIVFTDAAQDSQRQIDDVRMLMAYGIDLLVISPNDSDLLRPVIGEVYEKIPVIVLDRDVQGDAFTLFIGPNNLKIGQLAGEEVLAMLGDAGGNVVEILGTDGAPSAVERSRGFEAAISGHDSVRITQKLVAHWMQDQAEDRLKEYLIVSDEPIDVVFAQNDAMANGAYIAMQKLRAPEAKIVGVDGLEGPNGGVELVRKGVLAATFYCPTGGQQAVEIAMRILRGEKGIEKRIILDPVKISGVGELSSPPTLKMK